jgi:ABC-2 type transport system permease protein
VYLASRLLMAVLFALLVLLLLFTFATLVGGVRLSPLTWIAVISRLVLGSVPFAALGFAIGYAASPQAASGVANLIYLPLSLGSGLFVPLPALPPLVQQVAPILPTYHYGQLAWGAVGAPSEDPAVSAAWLAGYAVLFLAIAVRWYRVEEQRKFG